jgi:hypothetical protein
LILSFIRVTISYKEKARKKKFKKEITMIRVNVDFNEVPITICIDNYVFISEEKPSKFSDGEPSFVEVEEGWLELNCDEKDVPAGIMELLDDPETFNMLIEEHAGLINEAGEKAEGEYKW